LKIIQWIISNKIKSRRREQLMTHTRPADSTPLAAQFAVEFPKLAAVTLTASEKSVQDSNAQTLHTYCLHYFLSSNFQSV
jgi:hypothetical protein